METTTRPSSRSTDRRDSVRRSMGRRAVAAVVLILFVCYLGDLRRRSTAMAQMERFAVALTDRMGDSGTLPLNLDPEHLLDSEHTPIDLHTLSRTQVGCLRNLKEPILVAWTVRLAQVLGRNGRAIVTYEGGRTEASWITERQFNERRTSQTARLAGCE